MMKKEREDIMIKVLKLEHDIYGNGAKGMRDQILDINKNLLKVEKQVYALERKIYLAMGACSFAVVVLDYVLKIIK